MTDFKTCLRDFNAFLKSIKNREPIDAVESNFKNTMNTAAAAPTALYRFFYQYNVLNAGIASTIASLVGNISKSRDVFTDPEVPVHAVAGYSFEIANLVNQASVNEYNDPVFGNISHRLLAAGVLQAVGNFAEMDVATRNDVQTPQWLDDLVIKIQTLYSGKQNDVTALARALGAHIFSEFSADELEFSNACKALFVDRKNQGFHAHVKHNPLITVQGKTFRVDSWLKTHGGYDEEKEAIVHAAEYDHLEMAFGALKLWSSKSSAAEQDILMNAAFEGLRMMREYLDTFFTNAGKDDVQEVPIITSLCA
jgi:hypothetical protein